MWLVSYLGPAEGTAEGRSNSEAVETVDQTQNLIHNFGFIQDRLSLFLYGTTKDHFAHCNSEKTSMLI